MHGGIPMRLSALLSLSLLLAAACATTPQPPPNLVEFEQDGKFGFKDEQGKVVVGAVYESVGVLINGKVVVKKDGLYGVICINDEYIIEPQYEYVIVIPYNEDVRYFARHPIKGGSAYRWQYLFNEHGKIIFKSPFLNPFNQSHDLLHNGTFCGYYYKSNGKVFFKNPNYTVANTLSKYFKAVTLFPVMNLDQKWGFMDRSENFVIEPRFDAVDHFHDGLAVVMLDGKMGFIDTQGKVVIQIEYDEAQAFSEGLAAVRKNGKWGYVNKSGKLRLPYCYFIADSFCEGVASVKENEGGKWVNINQNGESISYDPCQSSGDVVGPSLCESYCDRVSSLVFPLHVVLSLLQGYKDTPITLQEFNSRYEGAEREYAIGKDKLLSLETPLKEIVDTLTLVGAYNEDELSFFKKLQGLYLHASKISKEIEVLLEEGKNIKTQAATNEIVEKVKPIKDRLDAIRKELAIQRESLRE